MASISELLGNERIQTGKLVTAPEAQKAASLTGDYKGTGISASTSGEIASEAGHKTKIFQQSTPIIGGLVSTVEGAVDTVNRHITNAKLFWKGLKGISEDPAKAYMLVNMALRNNKPIEAPPHKPTDIDQIFKNAGIDKIPGSNIVSGIADAALDSIRELGLGDLLGIDGNSPEVLRKVGQTQYPVDAETNVRQMALKGETGLNPPKHDIKSYEESFANGNPKDEAGSAKGATKIVYDNVRRNPIITGAIVESGANQNDTEDKQLFQTNDKNRKWSSDFDFTDYYKEINSPYRETFQSNSPLDTLDYVLNSLGVTTGYDSWQNFALGTDHQWSINIRPYESPYGTRTPKLPVVKTPVWGFDANGEFTVRTQEFDYSRQTPVIGYQITLGISREKVFELYNQSEMRINLGLSYPNLISLDIVDDVNANMRKYFNYYFNCVYDRVNSYVAPPHLGAFEIELIVFKPGYKVNWHFIFIGVPMNYNSIMEGNGGKDPQGISIKVDFSIIGIKNYTNPSTQSNYKYDAGSMSELPWTLVQMVDIDATREYSTVNQYENTDYQSEDEEEENVDEIIAMQQAMTQGQ